MRVAAVIVALVSFTACNRAEIDEALAAQGINDPVLAEALVFATETPPSLTDRQLQRLRWCESRGNYASVNRSGKYRGAYQFDRRTWAATGAPGTDPAVAPGFVQDAAARRLYAARGRAPWPVCGKQIGTS